jgi:uncharacterized phiE125 gp8 family phage protein
VIRTAIRTITAPADIPLLFDVDTARHEARVDLTGDDAFDAADDATLEAKIRAAMRHVENHTAQVLTDRELELAANGFPCLPELISIPREPVTEILSIAYTDNSTGAEVALAESDWRWSDASPAMILPAWRTSWPVAAAEPASVRIRFAAGYEDGLAPPDLVDAVMKMLVHLFEHRSAVESGASAAAVELPLTVRDLCAGYRRVLV